VSADPRNLLQADATRTAAVVSTSEVPTGAMVSDPAVSFPDRDELVRQIETKIKPSQGVFFDARRVASAIFGHDQLANILLAGAAYQAGYIPVPGDAIEDAIRLNGVQVDTNIQAFRRGRQIVADPEGMATVAGAALEPSTEQRPTNSRCPLVNTAVGTELERLVGQRFADLTAYQSAKYAADYARFVEMVRATEAERVQGSTQLTETVARYLYKLMAYKDEYEVARLCLAPQLQEDIASQFGRGAKIAYRLHPPMLRALGMKSKISLGQWVRPILRLLYAARWLRGTPFDPFGYAVLRRTERRLIAEYRDAVLEVLAQLSSDNHGEAIAIAALPDVVRGYEELKMSNVADYRLRLQSGQERYAAAVAPR
jgi:indolepyruvate ferredoxin oxidoreductase